MKPSFRRECLICLWISLKIVVLILLVRIRSTEFVYQGF